MGYLGPISWIFFGLLAGWAAKFLMPGKDPGGCVITSLLGIAGALLGGFLGSRFLGIENAMDWDFKSFGIAVAGSILLLLIYRMFKGK